MKRLFFVATAGSKKPVDDKYFESKQDAKKFRNEKMGALLAEATDKHSHWHNANAFHVAVGPDHIQFKPEVKRGR